MQILLVEDNTLLSHHLQERLSACDHHVSLAADGKEGLYMAREFPCDVAIIDLGLPSMDGFEVIRQVRQSGATFPILVLTARGNWQDKVEALQLGADDYVVKPFQFEELEARLNVLLRRSTGFVKSRIEGGPFVVDTHRKQAFVGEQVLNLTAYEYKILEYLMTHHQQVISKERLLSYLYGDNDEREANVVEVLTGRLRRKLDSAAGVNPIDTVRGQGYLFNVACH
ncbi:two-component system, OmpR family, response regulator PhoP [Atopomonas hussainii]|uniref:Two-component system, OmpR family, response regulator PhoP n=1 Tax=Atopomonas hussainii TaxID=1429083 RepID=A0A1H7K6A7_9GAMM|nr:response regulator transcription factor [Atopomonas hussainii]SEK82094.1 two-component system, OmpR family, response regulator PhoP [Atopomonas hussainii]